MITVITAVNNVASAESYNPRPGRHQPARRRVRQRPTAAGLRPAPDRGVGHDGGSAVRHLAPAPRLARMRLQNFDQVNELLKHCYFIALQPSLCLSSTAAAQAMQPYCF